jgi:transcriptional/translational regulatory protein YebC/TACO1
MFDKRGLIHVDRSGLEEDRVMEVVLDAGADDLTDAGEVFEVVTSPEKLEAVRGALDKAGMKVTSAEVTMVPKNTVHLTGHTAASALKFLEALEDHDDVQNVSANLDVDPEELEKLSAA